jgi:predicted permease
MAMVLALMTRTFGCPPSLMRMLEMLAATLVPLVMIAVGFRMRLRLPREVRTPLTAGLAIKLAVAPLLALGCCRLLGWDGEPARVAIMEAGMPPQISAGAVAIAAGLAPELVAAAVGYGIVISFATLPALYWLMG